MNRPRSLNIYHLIRVQDAAWAGMIEYSDINGKPGSFLSPENKKIIFMFRGKVFGIPQTFYFLLILKF